MYNVQPPTLWALSIGQNTLKHREIWFLAGVRIYVCARVRMCLMNHDVGYNGETVTSVLSLRFLCKLMSNLRFYGNLNFWKISFVTLLHFNKIWAIVLKLLSNIIYRLLIFGFEFSQNRLLYIFFQMLYFALKSINILPMRNALWIWLE